MSSDGEFEDDRHGGYGDYPSGWANDHDGIAPNINSFLHGFHNHKMQRSAGSSHASSAYDAYYEMGDWPSAPDEAATTERTRSSRSRTNPPSDVFSHRHGRRPSSYASGNTEQTEVDRNEIPPQEFDAYHVAHQPTTPARFACEFDNYTKCTETFGREEVPQWIEHTVGHFDSIGLPMVCLCWYCDKWEFNAEMVGGDKWMNFRNRMLHISNHIENNDGDLRPRRVDPWIVDHLWQNRAISSKVFTRETSRHEMPQIDGLLPAGVRSPVQLRRDDMNTRVLHDNGKEERHLKRQQRKKSNGKRRY